MPKRPDTPNSGVSMFRTKTSYSQEGKYHEHVDHQGIVHRCWHKCTSWVKIAVLVLVTDVICELVTFMPIHRLFEALGWIS